jgi:hypothetical protein
MIIEVLGTGGSKCRTLFCNALEALGESGYKGIVIEVKDIRKMIKYGVMTTPALVINGIVMFSGKLASPREIVALLHNLPQL